MRLLIKVSLRNLLRQKQRNILLGTGIAFGMTILILSNAFSHGLSDILLNRIVKSMAGHFVVMVQEKTGEKRRMIIRDKDRFEKIIRENVEGDVQIFEGISTQTTNTGGRGSMSQALGNGASSIIMVAGKDRESFMDQNHEVIAGRIEDIWENTNKENPVLIYDTIAENLNVKLNDTIRVRFSTVYGQVQAARFTVICILRSSNPFMSVSAFTSKETMKPLLGLLPHETGSLSVVINNLENPQRVIEQAKRLHSALQPGAAAFKGELIAGNRRVSVSVAGLASDLELQKDFINELGLRSWQTEPFWKEDRNVLISRQLAEKLNITEGENLSFNYVSKFEGTVPSQSIKVSGIYESNPLLTDDTVIIQPELLYETFFPIVPLHRIDIDRKNRLFPYLMKEWKVLEMSPDQESLMKKLSKLGEEGWRGRIVDVTTMYAIASQILSMEEVMNMVTLVAVLILFFIILIGVVNTLRMTIRERTREIGTIRAIGMQRQDVRWIFFLEVIFLALFASAAGTGLSFLLMEALSLPTFRPEGMFSIFLVDHHLHFLPTFSDIFTNMAIIVVITALTAILPAHRASRMSVAEALRFVE